MRPHHALLIAIAALTIGACAPTPEHSGITELGPPMCIVVDDGRLREVPC